MGKADPAEPSADRIAAARLLLRAWTAERALRAMRRDRDQEFGKLLSERNALDSRVHYLNRAVQGLREALEGCVAAMEAMHPSAHGDFDDAAAASLWNAALERADAVLDRDKT